MVTAETIMAEARPGQSVRTGAAAVSVLAAALAFVHAADIVVSKDSLRCSSAASGEMSDCVVFRNQTDYEIFSDSMCLSITEADAAFLARLGAEAPQAGIYLNNNSYAYTSQRRGTASFALMGSSVRTYPSGGDNYFAKFVLGYGLSNAAPVLPEWMRALLTVYFPNGEKVVLRLYTDAATAVVGTPGGRRDLSRPYAGVSPPLWMYRLDGRRYDRGNISPGGGRMTGDIRCAARPPSRSALIR